MNPPPAEGFASRLFLAPTLRTQPDKRLVTLVRDGYEAAFEEIVRRYGKALSRYAAAIVGGRSEDVTQDAFSKALLALRRDSDAEIELRPWLYRIVRNTALNDLRDRPPEAAELDVALAGGSLSAAEEAERREETAELMRRLRKLPEAQRAAIVMRELEGLGHEEIAAALGMSGGAARQAIFRARTTLRDGFGLLIPLPIVRTLIEHGAEAGAAAGAGGAAVAAGGAIGAGGAGTALKVGVVTAVLAGSVGTGFAIKENRVHDRDAANAAAATVGDGGGSTSAEAAATSPSRSAGLDFGSPAPAGQSGGGGGAPALGEVREANQGVSAAADDRGSDHQAPTESGEGAGHGPGPGPGRDHNGPGRGGHHGGGPGGEGHEPGGPQGPPRGQGGQPESGGAPPVRGSGGGPGPSHGGGPGPGGETQPPPPQPGEGEAPPPEGDSGERPPDPRGGGGRGPDGTGEEGGEKSS